MGDTEGTKGLSANLKKAVCWISEMTREHREKTRKEIISQAQLRFDLSPRECAFLDSNFVELTGLRDTTPS